MLARLRRRAALIGASAVLVSGGMLFVESTYQYAQATPVVLAPLIPEAASAIGTTCAATGPGCAVIAAGALAYGAWWLYNNWDAITLHDPSLNQGDPGHGQASPGDGWAWSWAPGTVPDPASGPYARTVGDMKFFPTCSGGYCGGFSSIGRCISPGGVVTEFGGGTTSHYENETADPFYYGNCVAPNMVAEITIAWGAGGGLHWKAGGTWDSVRTTTVTTTCKAPGGASSTTSITTTGTVGIERALTVPGCGTGQYVAGVDIKDGPAGVASDPRWSWAVDPGAESTYARCFSGSDPGLGGCLLRVTYLGLDCQDTTTNCVDWWTRSASHSTDYGCLWGPYSLPLTSCKPLLYAYVPNNGTDPTGLPRTPDPAPNPSLSPSPGTNTLPTAGPNPSPTTSVAFPPWTSSPQPFPTNGGNPLPGPDPGPAPSQGNCMGGMWSWNPVDWVVTPVKCALVWAFVPDAGTVAQLQSDASAAWASSSPGLWTAAAFTALSPITDLSSAGGGAYNCGIPVHFPFYTGHSLDFTLLNSCEPPLNGLAPIVKGFLTAVVIINGIWLGLRILGASFGWQLPSIGRGAAE